MATPRLSLSHTTIAVQDLDTMVDFYTEVLGFHVTNRGAPGPGQPELAFLSQDPAEHHQMVFIQGADTPDHQIVFADHLAFRTGSLDDLRAVADRLAEAGVDQVHPVSHGNAWSLYFNDPEGNGLECFVDSPFHVAQPYLRGLDLDASDGEIVETTRAELSDKPEFQPIEEWRSAFVSRLDASAAD